MIKRLKAAFKAFKKPGIIEEDKDLLTGVLSRKAFLRASEREFQRATRGEQSLVLAFIDLDNLKEKNDRYGHAEGDLYLKTFTQTALVHIRSFELLARWGGDEFVLLLSADEENAEQIICRIYNLFPNFSWGTSVWDKKEDFYTTLEKADKEMYGMKKRKKANDKLIKTPRIL